MANNTYSKNINGTGKAGQNTKCQSSSSKPKTGFSPERIAGKDKYNICDNEYEQKRDGKMDQGWM